MLAMCLAMLETVEQRNEFEKLYKEKRSRMYSIAMKHLHNKSDAENAVSEAFLRIANGQAKYFEIEPHKQGAFLDILIRNVSVDMFYHKKKEKLVDFSEEESEQYAEPYSFEDLFPEIKDTDKLVDFILSLPQKTKDAIYLKGFMMLQNKEISLQLGISQAAVRQRICYARKAIKQFIENGESYD